MVHQCFWRAEARRAKAGRAHHKSRKSKVASQKSQVQSRKFKVASSKSGACRRACSAAWDPIICSTSESSRRRRTTPVARRRAKLQPPLDRAARLSHASRPRWLGMTIRGSSATGRPETDRAPNTTAAAWRYRNVDEQPVAERTAAHVSVATSHLYSRHLVVTRAVHQACGC